MSEEREQYTVGYTDWNGLRWSVTAEIDLRQLAPVIERAIKNPERTAQVAGGLVQVQVRRLPPMPPMLEGETPEQYTDRLTGADGTGRTPYRERRFRQCSIGYHNECSDPEGEECECPCHRPESEWPDEYRQMERADR